MKEGLASILVPVFNGSKYIKEFLDSVLLQTYRPLELLIADDCSKDRSFSLCKEWAEKNRDKGLDIICYKNEKNLGLSRNISRLAGKAVGEFLFIADQDDVWKENKVEFQLKYMRKNSDCMISLCDRSITNERLEIVEESNYGYFHYGISVMNFAEVIRHKGAYAANTMVVRSSHKDCIFRIPGDVIQQDTFITVMASRYGTIDFLYEPLLLYRIHENNLSGNFGAEFSKNILQCYRRYYKVGKRICKSNRTDGLILQRELLARFGVKLEDYKNAFLNIEVIPPFVYAWRRTWRDYRAGNIGIWREEKRKRV